MSRYAELTHSRIYYDDVGRGDVVLLLHGLGLDLRMWDAQVPVLTERHRVVRLDLHGFGKSSRVTGPYSHSEIIGELLGYLEIERAHVVGLSYGGQLAAEFVQTYRQRARSLVLVDTDISGLPFKSLGQSFAEIFGVGKTDVEAAKQLWLHHEIFAAARGQPLVLARLEQMISDYSGWIFANAGARLERKPKPPSAEVLQDLRLPALVVVGELDLPDFQDMADEVVKRLPGARKVVLEGAGHLCNMEAPASFNRVLLEFLSTAN
jgi:3-oxoadipate enol-lactonase